MYYYYALTTLGIRSWWKPYLTMLQIVQFVIDIIFCYTASYIYFFVPSIFCNGTTLAALFGSGLLTSYLWLFIDFFITTYRTDKKAPGKGVASSKQTPKKKKDE